MNFMQHSYLKEATARQIVQRTMSIIRHSVNVMDDKGIIIASGDPSRIYQRHEGAILALTENRMVEIDGATANKLKGVKPGINLPIYFRHQLVGAVGVSGKPEEVYAYAELVKMAAELILEQVAMMEEIQWGKRYREELANLLIAGDSNSTSIESMAAYLSLDLSLPRVVVILELDIPEPNHLRGLLDFFETNERDCLVTLVNFRELVILKPIVLKQGVWDLQQERKQLQQLLLRLQPAHTARTIIGGYFTESNGVYRSYLSARATQEMVSNVNAEQKYLFYSEHTLPALLSGLAHGWQSEELTKSWQKLVDSDPKGVLQQTLKQYFDRNCDLSQTANQLYIHVNTLRYRLQKIERITNLKINELQDVLRLYISMQLQITTRQR